MIIFFIQSGLTDLLYSWDNVYSYFKQKNLPIKFVWKGFNERLYDFDKFFEVQDDIDIFPISESNDIDIENMFAYGMHFDVMLLWQMDRITKKSNGSQLKTEFANLVMSDKIYDFAIGEKNLLYKNTGTGINSLDVGQNLLINQLKPSQYINEKLLQYTSQFDFDFSECIGMHIRRGDFTRCIQESPPELFYNKIDELILEDKNRKIFLCTDDDELKNDILFKYPNNVISRKIKPRRISNKPEDDNTEDAVIDIFLMSKCQMIYGSNSPFNKFASQIGNIKRVILKKD